MNELEQRGLWCAECNTGEDLAFIDDLGYGHGCDGCNLIICAACGKDATEKESK